MAVEHIQSAEQFHAATAVEGVAVACFSASWCGGCKLVAPQVEALAQELSQLRFVGVSADNMEPLIEELEVTSFPTFRMYKGGKVLGELVSAKFDKVEDFIRGLITVDAPEADAGGEASIAEAATPPMSPTGSACDSGNDEEEESAAASKKRSEREAEAEDVHEPIQKRTKTNEDVALQQSVSEANDTKMADGDTDETTTSVDTANTTSEDVEIPEEDEEMVADDDQKNVGAEKSALDADENMASVEESVEVVSSESEVAPVTESVAVDAVDDGADTSDVMASDIAVEAVSEDNEVTEAAEATASEVSEEASSIVAASESAAEPSNAEATAAEAEDVAVEIAADVTEQPAAQEQGDTEGCVPEADTSEEATDATIQECSSTPAVSMNGDATAEQGEAANADASKSVEDGSSSTEENAIAA